MKIVIGNDLMSKASYKKVKLNSFENFFLFIKKNKNFYDYNCINKIIIEDKNKFFIFEAKK